MNNEPMKFDGSDYVHDRDAVRLTGQIKDVFNLMKNGNWYSLDDIAQATGHPHASVSAQLRHLRKPRFGSHEVDKEYHDRGLFYYRLIVNEDSEITY